MLTTPQTPLPEQPTTEQQPVQQSVQQQPQQPRAWQPLPPMAGYGIVAPSAQAGYMQPSSAQRMGLAIASLALMIPLIAIALGIMTSLMPYVAAGAAIAVGLFAFTLVCLTVIAVNVLFNWEGMRRR
ncbi:MAG: hypothetical protein KGO05_04840 [Chloroflexota bacterium]|nr:hypothetical protein [Chloroflexota bacterium]